MVAGSNPAVPTNHAAFSDSKILYVCSCINLSLPLKLPVFILKLCGRIFCVKALDFLTNLGLSTISLPQR